MSTKPSDEELFSQWEAAYFAETETTLRQGIIRFARALLSHYGRPVVDMDEYRAMEAAMEQINPATLPGLTATQRYALGRFAKPRPAGYAQPGYVGVTVWVGDMKCTMAVPTMPTTEFGKLLTKARQHPSYWEERIALVRDAALEEAARACEARIGTGEPGFGKDCLLEVDTECRLCAIAIRALKGNSHE